MVCCCVNGCFNVYGGFAISNDYMQNVPKVLGDLLNYGYNTLSLYSCDLTRHVEIKIPMKFVSLRFFEVSSYPTPLTDSQISYCKSHFAYTYGFSFASYYWVVANSSLSPNANVSSTHYSFYSNSSAELQVIENTNLRQIARYVKANTTIARDPTKPYDFYNPARYGVEAIFEFEDKPLKEYFDFRKYLREHHA